MLLILASLLLSPVYAGWLGCYDPAIAASIVDEATLYESNFPSMGECMDSCGQYYMYLPTTGQCGCGGDALFSHFDPAIVDTEGLEQCSPEQGEIGYNDNSPLPYTIGLGACFDQAWLYQGPYTGTTMPGPDTTSPADFIDIGYATDRYGCLKGCINNQYQNPGTPQTAALYNKDSLDGAGQTTCVCVDKSTMTGGSPSTCLDGNYLLYDVPPRTSPSGGMGMRRRAAIRREQTRLAKSNPYCPPRTRACAIEGSGYECVDTATELESCGGCINGDLGDATAALGADCVTLPGVHPLYVTCSAGQCVSSVCYTGFHLVNGTCFEE